MWTVCTKKSHNNHYLQWFLNNIYHIFSLRQSMDFLNSSQQRYPLESPVKNIKEKSCANTLTRVINITITIQGEGCNGIEETLILSHQCRWNLFAPCGCRNRNKPIRLTSYFSFYVFKFFNNSSKVSC